MKQNNKTNRIIFIIVFSFAVIYILGLIGLVKSVIGEDDKYFNILTNNENKQFAEELFNYGKENGINISFDYGDDLELVDKLNENSTLYDAVWMSNSTWLYMTSIRTLNSKSTNINPVVFGIKKSKAKSLGFIDKEVRNKDIVEAIKNNKLKYVMSSVTKTNTGLIAYLGFLNALSGSPELLTSDMLKKPSLVKDLKALFSGVQRVSGSDDFLNEMFLNSSEYEAVVATESALIEINKKLESSGKEPLYLIYPIDGVAVNDSPFAYVDNGQEKLDKFNIIQSYVLSKKFQNKLEESGRRTWYGGINNNANTVAFKTSWGIDTTKYLIPLKYPSKSVMNEAIELYLDELRKPSVTTFCLDVSGSMSGDGIIELKEAMNQVLDYEVAKKDKIQFSPKDKIFIIPFSNSEQTMLSTNSGRDTKSLISSVNNLETGGGTDLYGCAVEALRVTRRESDDYTKTIILMTDGQANIGSYSDLLMAYSTGEKIPIYGITFGNAREKDLNEIANLTNAKVFDGKTNLTQAFKDVRSYN